MKKTKIICTMGPNTNDRELIKQLALAGMDIARFNFSHGDHEEQAGRFALVESVRSELNLPIATLLDTKGPEIRTGLLKDDKKVTLVENQKYTLTTRDIVGDDKIGHITYDGLPKDISKGNTILIDDGLIELRVEDVVSVCEKSRGTEKFKTFVENPKTLPKWLEANVENYEGKVVAEPAREDIDVPVNETLIVELYSK